MKAGEKTSQAVGGQALVVDLITTGKTALQRAEQDRHLYEEIAMERAAYAGFCKDPSAIEQLESEAFDRGVESILGDCHKGLYKKEGIWSESQVRALLEECLLEHEVNDLMTKHGIAK